MTIIADSGSTKTTWMAVESGNKVVTEGLNPHFTGDEAFLAACAAVHQHFPLSTFHFPLHFYGAGCGSEVQRTRVASLLAKAFGTSDIHVETDMLGACRALCGHEAGLVGILGTGSNACYYDGKKITHQAVSTGYILGDHGSANHVGRLLLQDYLSGSMPEELSTLFHEAYPQSKDEFLDAVYHQPHANRFLASLAPFAVQHLGDDYCRRVVEHTLEDWLTDALMPLWRQVGDVTLHVVGGYAKAIEPTLRLVMEDRGLAVGTVLSDPIDGLRRFHG